ncbi:MAG TPA: hypothetical protein VJ892_03355 [Candidatus Absconditabacterales bacterium]|nr:hypothetical protein [Candidatus Absconditabacterales bacterium]
MTKLTNQNGTYFGLTKKELLWLAQNEKNLPQMESNKNLILLTPEEMKKLFDK